MTSEGKTLGELLLEGDPQKLQALDIEQNKKSRVSAAQFASYEAIANTLRSSQLDTTVSQLEPEVKTESLTTGEEGTVFAENGDHVAPSTAGKRDNRLSAIVDEIQKTLPKTEAEIPEAEVEQADL